MTIDDFKSQVSQNVKFAQIRSKPVPVQYCRCTVLYPSLTVLSPSPSSPSPSPLMSTSITPIISPVHSAHLGHPDPDPGTTHGHQSNDPPPMTHSLSVSSASSYSAISLPRSVIDVSNAPHLGSSHSESEPHFPGAWVNTAPGTPAPLNDDRDNFAEQMKNANLNERSRAALPPPLRTSLVLENCLARTAMYLYSFISLTLRYSPAGSSSDDVTQVPSGLPKTSDPSLPTAGRDASTEVAGPNTRLADPQIEYAEPTSTTKANPVYATSIVNTAREYPIAGMTSVHYSLILRST